MKKKTEAIRNIISWVFTVLSVGIMIFTIISSTVLNRNDKSIFGYKAFIVLSDSMSATDFSAGDVVVSKSIDPSTLKVGDIITFQSENSESYGQTVTHKIREITRDAEGNPGFITYGTTTDTNDETIVSFPFVLGKYLFRIPKLGTFFYFLKTTPGYFICIFIPFMILILIQAIKSINLFRQYKKEQKEEIDEERQKLADERARNEEMMKQLLEMRDQLAKQNSQPEEATQAEENKEEEKNIEE